jgi:hypothetical protein
VLSTLAVILSVAFLLEASDASPERHRVSIQGIEEQYPSCAVVTPTIGNTGTESLYIEVYVEENSGGEDWSSTCGVYDLTDPRSRHIKRIIVNPRMTDPGKALSVSYDRCADRAWCESAKRSVTREQVRRDLARADADARPPVRERFRVDLYELVQGHVEPVGREYSRPFTRSGQDAQSK